MSGTETGGGHHCEYALLYDKAFRENDEFRTRIATHETALRTLASRLCPGPANDTGHHAGDPDCECAEIIAAAKREATDRTARAATKGEATDICRCASVVCEGFRCGNKAETGSRFCESHTLRTATKGEG